MAEEIIGSEQIKRDIRTKAEVYFEVVLTERPDLRATWLTLKETNPHAFDVIREAWIHGFSEACKRLIRFGKI